MKLRFLFILAITQFMALSAQLKEFSLDNLMPGGKTYARFVPKNIKQLQFLGENYIYQKGDSIMIVKPGNHKEKVLVTVKDINRFIAKKGLKPVGSMPRISVWEGGKENGISFLHDKHFIHLSADGNSIEQLYPLEKGDTDFDFDPHKRQYALTNENGLYIILPNGERITVGKDSNGYISMGANNVHRNEFGIKKGTFWSPEGNALAFYRMNETMVGDYPLVDISAREAKLKNIKYPMAGMRSHEVTVGVFRLSDRNTVYLHTGTPKDRYFTNITWSPDEKEIYIQELNRRQDTCRVEVYDAASGKHLRTLFTETDEKYVEPENPLIFIPGKSELFIYTSRKDGYRHLYLYDTSGKMIRQITRGEWEVLSAEIDPTGKYLYITSTEASPLEVNLYRVTLSNGKRERLTPANGVHTPLMSKSGRYMIDRYSNHNTPRMIDFSDLKTGKTKNLLCAPDPYDGYAMPDIKCGTIKAADGETDLYYRLTQPGKIETGKKYPVIVYVYGGPHVQQVRDGWKWDARGWDIYMANRGYIIFTIDGRGSANRGSAFENVTHRQLGKIELQDQMEGIKWLKSLPYVDENRIGVHGWSFGGFMTTNMMLNNPETFKTGVAGGPVIDWKYYEIMYGERYMGSPKENAQGYKNSNLNRIAGNLQGHLLLIHGDQDPVVVWQHSLSFLKSCIQSGTYPDYFVYPGHFHNVLGPDRVHLYEKITRYFDDYLK